MKRIAATILIGLSVPMFGVGSQGFNWNRFLSALQKVETGGIKNPDFARGDNGKALGRYQLHRGYVLDAKSQDKTLTGAWVDIAQDEFKSASAVVAYLTKYAEKEINSGNAEMMFAAHNSGPAYLKKLDKTIEYRKKAMRFYNDE